jgi:hypothetical protein
MSLDITNVDRTESSLRADDQPPWADLPQSALGSAKVNTHQNEAHKRYTLQTVSAKSLGHYA